MLILKSIINLKNKTSLQDIFDYIDIRKDGKIDINEFIESFKRIDTVSHYLNSILIYIYLYIYIKIISMNNFIN